MMALTQPHSQRQMDLFSVSFWALAVRGSAQNPCHSEGDLLLGHCLESIWIQKGKILQRLVTGRVYNNTYPV